MLPPLTYLTVDSLAEGVGASQVLPYVERLGQRGLDITVHSFERSNSAPDLERRLHSSGVSWRPHSFGAPGRRGGLQRVLHLAQAARGADLVHARSDLAAAAAMLGGAERWVWDVRSLWADQRIELGMLHAGSPEERVLRWVERRAARSSAAIVTLAAAALPVLEDRHGAGLTAKASVIPTCVDLDRFALAPMPDGDLLQVLFSGSLNRYYDVPTMLRLVERSRRRRPTQMTVLSPAATSWDDALATAGVHRQTAAPAAVPDHVQASHVGLGVCRTDVGDSLRAAMPTKLGEFLATGRPIVVNRGLGDMDALIGEYGCGVVLHGGDDEALDTAIEELHALVADPDTPNRCRALAEAHFDLDDAVERLTNVYLTVASLT